LKRRAVGRVIGRDQKGHCPYFEPLPKPTVPEQGIPAWQHVVRNHDSFIFLIRFDGLLKGDVS